MSAVSHHDESRARAVDRLCELTSIAAGHAAGALATLLARPFEMSVPKARVLEPGRADVALATRLGGDVRAWSGALFEVNGGLGGTLAVLFPPASRDALLAALLGDSAGIEPQAESALREVGNIVSSHALSAMGALLGVSVLPSTPQLTAQKQAADAVQGAAIAAYVAGGVVAAVGTILLYLNRLQPYRITVGVTGGQRSMTLLPYISPSGGGVALGGEL